MQEGSDTSGAMQEGSDHHSRDRVGDVLVVEPDHRDARLIHRGFDGTDLTVTGVSDGKQALELLSNGSREDGKDSLPGLVILAFDLEPIDGETVLDAIKSSPRLSALPVVILTHSERTADVARTRALGANCHLRKPADSETYVDQLEAVVRFWFDWASLPRSS